MTRSDYKRFLQAAQQHSRAAWESLYADHAPAILGYLRTQYPAMAEDLLGETFLCAVRDIASFKGNEKDMRNWLMRIAHNRLIDLRRAERSRPSVASDVAPEKAGEDAEFDRVLAKSDSFGQIEQLMEDLSADQRAVLYLRYIVDLDQRDTAAILEMSVPAVKMAQQRALRAVAESSSKKGAASTL